MSRYLQICAAGYTQDVERAPMKGELKACTAASTSLTDGRAEQPHSQTELFACRPAAVEGHVSLSLKTSVSFLACHYVF